MPTGFTRGWPSATCPTTHCSRCWPQFVTAASARSTDAAAFRHGCSSSRLFHGANTGTVAVDEPTGHGKPIPGGLRKERDVHGFCLKGPVAGNASTACHFWSAFGHSQILATNGPSRGGERSRRQWHGFASQLISYLNHLFSDQA